MRFRAPAAAGNLCPRSDAHLVFIVEQPPHQTLERESGIEQLVVANAAGEDRHVFPLRMVHSHVQPFAALLTLGEVLHLRGTPDALREAEQSFRQALRLDPGAWEVHQHLGQLLFTQGRYADAAAELEQALRSNDLNPVPYPTLMQCYLRLGRKAEVPRLQAKYRKIEEIDLSTGPLEYTVEAMPENTAVRLKLARLYKKFGRPDMALAQIDAVLKINPNLPEALRLQHEWKSARP